MLGREEPKVSPSLSPFLPWHRLSLISYIWAPSSSLMGRFQSTVIRFHGFNPLGMQQLPYTWQVLNAAFRGDYHLWLNREKRGGEEKFPLPHGVGRRMKTAWFAAAAGALWDRRREQGIQEKAFLQGPDKIFISNKKNMDNAAHVGHPSQFSWCLLQLVCVYRGILLILLLHRAKTLQNKWD